MSGLADLSSDEFDILRDVVSTGRNLPTHTELCVENRVQSPLVLLAGWACYQRLLGDGRRQIISFILPGDIIGPVTRPTLPTPNTALALTPVVVADARLLLSSLETGAQQQPGLVSALNQMGYADDVRFRDHVVRLGRQTAYERVVHLMLEFSSRLDAIGQVSEQGFALPVTQEILADALGLSVVHINRTLQQIRRDRLFDLRSGHVTLRQIDLMKAMADWSPPLVQQPTPRD
jgi:CRP-like cAMP-binding protein